MRPTENKDFYDQIIVHRDCYIWTGPRSNGYGLYKGKYAHRVAFFLVYRYEPVVVRHSCHTPLCVRALHLKGGTQVDNIRDTLQVGNAGPQKIPIEFVLEIRKLFDSGVHRKTIAEQYQLSLRHIYDIGARRVWAWIDEQGERRCD